MQIHQGKLLGAFEDNVVPSVGEFFITTAGCEVAHWFIRKLAQSVTHETIIVCGVHGHLDKTLWLRGMGKLRKRLIQRQNTLLIEIDDGGDSRILSDWLPFETNYEVRRLRELMSVRGPGSPTAR